MKTFVEQIEAYILSGCTFSKERAVGVEIETIFYNKTGNRIPVNPGSKFSAMDFIQAIKSSCKEMDTFISCSLEPGGQVEWASKPAYNIHDIFNELSDLQKIMNNVCTENKLQMVDLALDPIYSPNNITLIDQRKYQLMHDLFTTTGKHGAWMMRNTASVQVNIDLLDKKDAEECGFIADCISPFSAVLFSNTPFMNSHPIGYENMRYRIWEDTDPTRCGHLLDHGIHGSAGLLTQYCHYVLDVPVIFTTPDKSGEAGYFNGTIKQLLKSISDKKDIDTEDIKTALHQIFTHQRYKTVLELRTADRPPNDFELAPIAFWLALMEQGEIRDTILEQIILWSTQERKDLNIKASSLDISQTGPGDKTILQWLEWLVELVYNSLDIRATRLNIESEKKYIEPFINSVLSKGVFTLQTQKQFAQQESPVKEFIMKKNTNV